MGSSTLDNPHILREAVLADMEGMSDLEVRVRDWETLGCGYPCATPAVNGLCIWLVCPVDLVIRLPLLVWCWLLRFVGGVIFGVLIRFL